MNRRACVEWVEQSVVHDDRFGPVHGHVDELWVNAGPHRFGDEQVAGFGAVVERVEVVVVDVDQIDGGALFQQVPGRVVGAAMTFENADACAFEVFQCE